MTPSPTDVGLPAGFDPALPGLADSLDASVVARSFENHWPGAGDGRRPVRVVSCTRHDVRYQPTVHCAVTWDLRFIRNGQPPARTLGVVEIDATGRRLRLFSDDPALPGLACASDPEVMGARLAAALGEPATTCHATVVRYRPGERAVVRYDLGVPGGSLTLYGKVLGAGAESLASTLSAWRSAVGTTPALPDVGTPVAVFVDLAMVVQRATPGTTLGALLFGPDARRGAGPESLEWAGRCLAAIHRSAPLPSERSTFDDLLAPPRATLGLVARARPELASALDRALESLSTNAFDEDPGVPSHGSYRADHLLIDGARSFVIDVDGTCVAAPERDAGNLLAYLRWKAIREPAHAPTVDPAADALAAGYASHRPVLDPRRLGAYEAAALLRIAAGRFRNLVVDEWPLVADLVAAARVGAGSSTAKT